jgi:pyridoxine 4-dehydrogenase
MGCGTWAWGNRFLWGYSEQQDRDLQQVFETCIAAGVTLFDSGDSYGTGRLKGRSESLLGQFAHQLEPAAQASLCLATKLAPYPWRLSRGAMVQAGRASAARFGRPIDLVQLHWSTANYAPWQEAALLNGLADLYSQGAVRGVGLSNFGPQRLRWAHRRLQAQGVPLTSLQVQYSLLTYEPGPDAELRATCRELGVQLIAYSPLTLGLLTGKYSERGPLPSGVRGLLFRQLLPKVRPLLGCLREVATQTGRSPAQVALNWCLQKETIPIPGARSLTQARENLGALDWDLPAAAVLELDQAAGRCTGRMTRNIFQSR